MDKTVTEGNKLIAEFMGKKRRYESSEQFFLESLKYHTSWDWQIPAWSKVCFDIKKMVYGDTVKTDFYLHLLNEYENCVCFNAPGRGQEVLVKAIKWYNQNK